MDIVKELSFVPKITHKTIKALGVKNPLMACLCGDRLIVSSEHRSKDFYSLFRIDAYGNLDPLFLNRDGSWSIYRFCSTEPHRFLTMESEYCSDTGNLIHKFVGDEGWGVGDIAFSKNLYLVKFYRGFNDLFETLWVVYDKDYKLVSKNLIDIDAEIHGDLLIGPRRFKSEDYVAGSRCSVLCVNAVSSEPVWEYDYAWMNEGARKFRAQFAVSGNCVLVTCCRFLVGLCINTGKELFRYDVAGQTGDDSFSHPVIDGYVSVATPHAIEKNQSAVFYVDRLDSNCSEVMSYVMAFSCLDGRVLWIKPSKRRTRLHLHDDDILFSSFEGDMTAYDVATGEIIWRADKTPSMGLVTSNATSLCVSNHYNDGFSIYCQVDGRESMESRNKKNAKKIRLQISVDNLVAMLKKEFLGSSCNKEEVMSLEEFLDFSASERVSRRQYRMWEFIEANPELCHAIFAFIVMHMEGVNKDNENFNGNLETLIVKLTRRSYIPDLKMLRTAILHAPHSRIAEVLVDMAGFSENTTEVLSLLRWTKKQWKASFDVVGNCDDSIRAIKDWEKRGPKSGSE